MCQPFLREFGVPSCRVSLQLGLSGLFLGVAHDVHELVRPFGLLKLVDLRGDQLENLLGVVFLLLEPCRMLGPQLRGSFPRRVSKPDHRCEELCYLLGAFFGTG